MFNRLRSQFADIDSPSSVGMFSSHNVLRPTIDVHNLRWIIYLLVYMVCNFRSFLSFYSLIFTTLCYAEYGIATASHPSVRNVEISG